MSTIQRFEDLEIWQTARDICCEINSITGRNYSNRDFTLVDQIRRSSGSAMDNIAEGSERDGNKEFNHFLSISKGSIGESRSQLYRALDFNDIEQEEFDVLYEKCMKQSRQLQKFSDYLRNSPLKGRKFQ